MSSSTRASIIDPPHGWTAEDAHLLKNYYWTNGTHSLKGVLSTHYDLENADPVWARSPQYGAVQFIFEASPAGNQKKYFYLWNGLEDTVAQFEEESLAVIQSQINTHGEGKGYLGKLKFRDV